MFRQALELNKTFFKSGFVQAYYLFVGKKVLTFQVSISSSGKCKK